MTLSRLFPRAIATAAIGCLLWTPALRAQTPAAPAAPTDAFIDAARLRALTDSLATAFRATGRPVPGKLIAGDDSTFAIILLRRDTSGAPEVHARWADIFVAQAGEGTLITGGRADGAREVEPGEWRGGTIVSAASRPVVRRTFRPGDVVVIPAGEPHQVQVAPGGSITYLVVKSSGGRGSH